MCTPRVLFGLLAFVALGGSSASADTWVVDVNGGGDFTSLQVAIDSVAPGDVLLVEPGNYGSFVLDKPLSILGDPSVRPRFTVGSVAAREATLAGLRGHGLRIDGASGPVLLDHCFLDGDLPTGQGCDGTLIVEDCAQVHVQRSTILGKEGDVICESVGLSLVDSHVTLTDCYAKGGDGWGDAFWGADGREAILAHGASTLLLAQTDCQGGHGGAPQVSIHVNGGSGVHAIGVWDESVCTVRGNSDCLIAGGEAGDEAGHDAFAPVSGYGTLVLSGVSYWPLHMSGILEVHFPDPDEAFLLLSGWDAPGSAKRLEVYGSDRQQVWLLAAYQHALFELGVVSGSLYLDPSASVFSALVTPQGQLRPEVVSIRLPDRLIGLEGQQLVFQGFVFSPGTAGPYLASNPVEIVLRH